ncbi:PAS domain-containing protein [Psychrosphaera haliotis]|nr:PAS domain-containing protein [Psychrosphaera haliotis]
MQITNMDSFFYSDYMPHGHCYMWQPHILWTNVIADLLIAAAYFSIPVALMVFAKRRPDMGYQKVVWLFSLFILCCGITHLFGIITIWQGLYGWHGLLKSMTAIVSISTAIYLYRILPTLITISTPKQVEGIKQKLNSISQERNQLSMQIEQQKLVQFMLDSMPIGACLLNKNLEVTLCNDTFYQDTAIKKGDEVGLPLFSLISSTDSEGVQTLTSLVKNIEKGNSNALISKIIVQLKSVNGKTFPAEIRLARKVFNECDYYIFTAQNQTEMTDIKYQLFESNQKLQRAIDATEDGLWEYTIENNSISWSHRFNELIGANDKTPTIEVWKEHVHEDYVDSVIEKLKSAFNANKRFSIEYLGINSKGEFGWFNLIGKTTLNELKEPVTISGSLSYIQDSKALKRQVAEKTELLNAIYEGANNSIWVVAVEKTKQFRFLLFNRAASEKLGSKPENIAGKRLLEIDNNVLSKTVVNKLTDHLQACVDIKSISEYTEMIPMDGQPCWYHTSLYPILENGNVVRIVGSSIDITSQKDIELQLNENKIFLENILDSSICAASLFDLTIQKTTKINQRFTDILGYNIEEINTPENRLNLYHSEDLNKISTHIEVVIQSPLNTSHSIEYRYRHKNGDWRWCRTYTSIIKRDANNNPLIMLTTFIDISEQILLLDSLQESNAYLERFAMVASHDLQEPLRKIVTFSGLLSDTLENQYDLDDDSKYQFDRIKDAANRMRVMITDILGLSQISSFSVHRTKTELRDIIASAQDQLQLVIEDSGATITIKNGETLLNVDKSLMIQLIQNLIGNAIKFKSEQLPLISITAENTEYSTKIVIKDNGIGMESKYCKQIFEPFKRLHSKDKYQGSGIGLAICQQVCKVHSGSISCSSKIGVGTTFTITLPN